MKIAYITAKIPFGAQETFILTELLALIASGADLLIVPRDRGSKIFHKEAKLLVDYSLNISWFDFKIFIKLLKFISTKPIQFFILINDIFLKARNIKIGTKNLIILPKAIYISSLFKEKSISHIHAHWASTTATMAYIISKVTGIPWSFTAHRWDIAENNILKEKCKSASFIRSISKNGQTEIMEIIKDTSLNDKILVIHMGINKPETNKTNSLALDTFTILCPANLLVIKGHRYLFEACNILLERNLPIKCLIAGDGPLENKLRDLVLKLGLNNIEFLGRLPHEKLLDLYRRGLIDAVVLPSITTINGLKEGIPVALMEAMSYGIPVISTNTGGIAELIEDGCGIMVEEKNPEAIANAIEKLMKNTNYRDWIGKKGREKVQKDFNVSVISQNLLNLFLTFSS